MFLRTSLPHRYWRDQPLCEVEVVSSRCSWWRPGYVQRRIQAVVSSTTEFWQPFTDEWFRMRLNPMIEDSKEFVAVGELQVDYDLYGLYSWVFVDGLRVDLILSERFDGDIENYPKAVLDRNRIMESRMQRWKQGNISRNYLRKLRGLEPIDSGYMNEKIEKGVLEEMKVIFLNDPVTGLSLRTNLVS